MESSKTTTDNTPLTQPAASLSRPGDARLGSRFLKALRAPPASHAFESQHTYRSPASQSPPVTQRDDSNQELATLLERVCSGLYIGDSSVASQRMLLSLDHVMPGAAAEIVREGMHLTVRLYARTQNSYRMMSSQREALFSALNSHGDKRVDLTVFYGAADIDARGLRSR